MKTTGLSRISKEIIIAEIEKKLKTKKPFFITQYGTISATALDALRAKLRASKTNYFVVKGSLGRKAFEKANMKEMGDQIDGACGLAFSEGDIVASSKTLVDFAKANEVFQIKGAWFDGKAVSVEQVKTLASLPSREVLIARTVRGIGAPLSRLATVLQGTMRGVVNVLDAIAKKKGSGS